MIDSIIPKSNPVPQGIFCLGVMFVQLDLSHSRRRRRWWLLPLVPAVLWLCLPRLAAALPAAAARADRVIGARYTARLDALQQENFALHQRLAASADAVVENKALRSLLGSERAVGCVTPARVLARTPGGLTLACPDAAPGAAVLDAGGRYAGTVTSSDGNCYSSLYRSSRAVRQLCWAGRAGKVGADRPARRLHADRRGDRDHPGRGLAGYAGRSPGPRCRRTDGLRPADRYRRSARCRIFCAHRLIFCRNSAIINVFEIHDMR